MNISERIQTIESNESQTKPSNASWSTEGQKERVVKKIQRSKEPPAGSVEFIAFMVFGAVLVALGCLLYRGLLDAMKQFNQVMNTSASTIANRISASGSDLQKDFLSKPLKVDIKHKLSFWS